MLFGHQNDNTAQQAVQSVGANPLAVDPATGASLPTAPVATPQPLSLDPPSVLNQPTNQSSDDTTDTGSIEPTLPFPPAPAPEPDQATAAAPAPAPEPKPATEPTPIEEPAPAPSPSPDPTPAAPEDLLSIKQQALTQLSPLVDQLEQSPEEKFRTTMMLIQSTDDPSRLKDAYDAAQSIEDEKVRAQALLDIVNEINYFTQTKPAE